ncbi:ABC transporter substrate-binding protein [Sneathia sp. DSM 16631]|uniref:ABC transporter substrate-binding protein n=1 Tax=Sneathia TaxID=168808 RepID=UPI00186719DE|nr:MULTISPECIES: ABC transporter substrate-binding protein [Sneathia]MBE3031150.1 ABC transporter substrate-binding protein [Sneathia sp. DSM 16631]MDK9581614.1 ABC transporter substrate-binding protein [Sneathia vaginalis]
MKKLIYLLILIPFFFTSCKKQEKAITIGIAKVVDHPSINEIEKGIKDGLKDKNIKIEVKSANGEIATADLIAKSFKMSNMSAVIGIGTLPSQALKSANTDTPVIFSCVTDPVSANLKGDNITGICDRLDTTYDELKLLKKAFPKVKNIGIIYSTSELNSLAHIKDIETNAKKLNLNVIKLGVTNSSEIPQVTTNLLNKADAIYVPIDNLVVANISYLITKANEKRKPLIASDSSSVKLGALFSIGLDYYELGKQTANILLEVLNGKKTSDIPVQMAKNTRLFVNKETEKLLNVKIGD